MLHCVEILYRIDAKYFMVGIFVLIPSERISIELQWPLEKV